MWPAGVPSRPLVNTCAKSGCGHDCPSSDDVPLRLRASSDFSPHPKVTSYRPRARIIINITYSSAFRSVWMRDPNARSLSLRGLHITATPVDMRRTRHEMHRQSEFYETASNRPQSHGHTVLPYVTNHDHRKHIADTRRSRCCTHRLAELLASEIESNSMPRRTASARHVLSGAEFGRIVECEADTTSRPSG